MQAAKDSPGGGEERGRWRQQWRLMGEPRGALLSVSSMAFFLSPFLKCVPTS